MNRRASSRCFTVGCVSWWLCCTLVVMLSYAEITDHRDVSWLPLDVSTTSREGQQLSDEVHSQTLRFPRQEIFRSQDLNSRRQGVPWRIPDSPRSYPEHRHADFQGSLQTSWRPPEQGIGNPASWEPFQTQQSRQSHKFIDANIGSLPSSDSSINMQSRYADQYNSSPTAFQRSNNPVANYSVGNKAETFRFHNNSYRSGDVSSGTSEFLKRLPNGNLISTNIYQYRSYSPYDQAPLRSSRIAKTDVAFASESPEDESGRGLFGPGRRETLAAITETLGAINTVGQYLVNITRGGEDADDVGALPGAIYTISKNVLGPNVTDTIAPLVRGALPPLVSLNPGKVTLDVKADDTGEGGRPCTTPDGRTGTCDDLSSCPQLLLDLGNLRQSICFQSLFVPGVCCPRRDITTTFVTTRPEIVTTVRTTTTRRPPTTSTRRPPSLVVTSSTSVISASPTQRPTVVPSSDCGQPEVPAFRVVGGEESLPGRWPWMAAIFLHGARRTEFWCGGSLVGPRHVLTAAHCTRDSRQRPFSPRQFTVRLGDVDLKREDEPSAPETFHVVEVRAHPHFSRVGFYNDIALLVLDRDIRRSRFVIPLCLPTAKYRHDPFVGQKPTVVGWGTTYYGGKESTVQRQAQLPVWRNDDCDRTYFQPITSTFICAGYTEGGKDACQGDSGGPLMLKADGRWMQIGIVSFGNKCGEPGYPGVYTRVTEYVDWVQDNMVK